MSSCPDSHHVPNMKSQMSPTVDSEREEFRKYLEAGGLLDVLTGIFEELYEMKERPSDPLAYFTSTLCAVNYESFEMASLEEENKELKFVIENLENENAELKSKLESVSSQES